MGAFIARLNAGGECGAMSDTTQRWSTWSNIATVIAAVIAAGAFAFGAKTELDAARAQAQATVLQLLQAQIQLAVEYPELSARAADDTAALEDPRYIWFALNALMTADTVHSLVGTDPTWENAALGLVEQHLPFVLSEDFPCPIFNPAFVRIVREETREEAAQAGVTVCPDV
jgi:hypothetical protein